MRNGAVPQGLGDLQAVLQGKLHQFVLQLRSCHRKLLAQAVGALSATVLTEYGTIAWNEDSTGASSESDSLEP